MKSPYAQLPLDLSFRSARAREDFLVAPCNEAAVAWIDRYPDWPLPAAVICGPPGSGKSHLLAVWAEAAGALALDGCSLAVADLDRRIGTTMGVSVDDSDQVPEPDALFHLLNMMRERGGHVLLAARAPPARWTLGTADLRSRLTAAPLLELGSPDDTVLQAVLLKQFNDRRLDPGPEVFRFLIDRMPRTFEAAGAVAAEIDRIGLAQRRRPTVPLARQALMTLGYLAAEE